MRTAQTAGHSVVRGVLDLQAADPAAAHTALVQYLDCSRRLLQRQEGYESQQIDSDLMLAFRSSAAAILWCLLVGSHCGCDKLACSLALRASLLVAVAPPGWPTA